MTARDDIAPHLQEVSTLLHERLGARGRDLGRQVRRAGRRLPRRLRAEAAVLVQAAEMAAHPRLARRVDGAAVARAARVLSDHLRQVNPAERRRTRIVGMAAVVAFNLMVLGAGVVGVLVWRGYV